MRMPRFQKFFAMLKARKKLRAMAAARRAPMDEYDDEPQTRLSSAFVVVLILHVVAVGGIYAFNSIKAHRTAREPVTTPAPLAKAAAKPAATIAPSAETIESLPGVPPAAAPALIAPAPISGQRVHHVKSGDNLTKIAALHGVTVADLEDANGVKAAATLRPGQVLNIPPVKPTAKKSEEPPKVAATTKAAPKTYVVAKGDNPVAIARKLGVSYAELLKLNNIGDPKKLQVGQTLKVPGKKN